MTDNETTTEQPSRKRRKRQIPPATVVEQAPVEAARTDLAAVELPSLAALEATLQAGGIDLEALGAVHLGIQTYQYLTGARDGGLSMFAALIGAGTPEPCEQLAATLAAWFWLRDDSYFSAVSRGAAELEAASQVDAAALGGESD